MKQPDQLEDLYNELNGDEVCTLYVAPPIRYAYKKSDYLFLFYRDLLSSETYTISGVSTAGHLKFILARLFRKRCILHYHWIECTGFFSMFVYFYKLICLFLYKALGGKLIWSVHNKMPMDCRMEWVNYRGRRWIAKKADLLHIECESAAAEISTFFGVHEKKMRFWPHPEYPPQLMPRAAAIEAVNHRYNVNLKVNDRLFLMFGHISAYKQTDKVCEMFLNEPIQKKLIIVGPVKKGQMKLYKKVRRLSRKKDNIVLIPQFIKEECVPEFMNAADFVLFNYRDVLSSGGVPLAKSYGKPIILPRKGCLHEQEGEELTFFNTQEELRKIIRSL
jgi:glycosyltransferase involved in cell wall biosynthesis